MDIVQAETGIVVPPANNLAVYSTDPLVVPNRWAVVPSGGDMPSYEGVNAAVEARIIQVRNDMGADLDTRTSQLLAQISDVETSVSSERSARISEDEAIATRIDTEVARIDSNVAAVQSGVITNADNHTVLAQEYSQFVARTDSAIASANNEISVLATKTDANASAINQLSVTMDGREASYSEAIELEVTQNYAHFYYPVSVDNLPIDYIAGDYMRFGFDFDQTYTEGTVAKAVADSAGSFDISDWIRPADQTVPRQYSSISKKIEALEVTTNDLDARITTEQSARADADTALSSRIDTVEADYKNADSSLGARITTEENARASADNALSARTSTLESEFGNLDVRLTSTENTVAGYFSVWDGVSQPEIGQFKEDDDGTTWQYLGGSLGDNSDGWVKMNPQDDIYLTRKKIDISEKLFHEVFDYNDVDQFLGNTLFALNTATAGNISFIEEPDASGGIVMRVGDNSGNDQQSIILGKQIPYNPEKLYRMTARVRRISGSGRIYAGVIGYKADKTTLVSAFGQNSTGPAHYICFGGYSPPSTSFVTASGYFSQKASTGDTAAHPDPNNPGKLHQDCVYFAPFIIVNYSAQPGITDFDYVEIEEISDINSITNELNKNSDPNNLLLWTGISTAGTGWSHGSTYEASTRFPPYVRTQLYRNSYETKTIGGILNSYDQDCHIIPVDPGEAIYISGWVNAESVVAGGQVKIGARLAIDGVVQTSWPVLLVANGQDPGWKYFEVQLTIPSGYNGLVPFTLIHAVNGDGTLNWSDVGTAMWAQIVYSRTPHRKRTNEIAGWAAGASKLITDPVTGAVTGWSFADGSNLQSRFKIMADVLSIVDTDDNSRTLYDAGIWRSYDTNGNFSELSAGSLKFFKAGSQTPFNYVKFLVNGRTYSSSTGSLSDFYSLPTIFVVNSDAQSYMQEYSDYDQYKNAYVYDLTGDSASGNWTFKIKSYIRLGTYRPQVDIFELNQQFHPTGSGSSMTTQSMLIAPKVDPNYQYGFGSYSISLEMYAGEAKDYTIYIDSSTDNSQWSNLTSFRITSSNRFEEVFVRSYSYSTTYPPKIYFRVRVVNNTQYPISTHYFRLSKVKIVSDERYGTWNSIVTTYGYVDWIAIG